jgi:DtxR family Mn-dependent transcriptional regulator
VERKLLAMLGQPAESPYGNPIPGLEEIGGLEHNQLEFRRGVRTLIEAVAAAGADTDAAPAVFVVRRLGEPVQTETDVLEAFARAGLRPGVSIKAQRVAHSVRVEVGDNSLVLDLAAASHVFVATD